MNNICCIRNRQGFIIYDECVVIVQYPFDHVKCVGIFFDKLFYGVYCYSGSFLYRKGIYTGRNRRKCKASDMIVNFLVVYFKAITLTK